MKNNGTIHQRYIYVIIFFTAAVLLFLMVRGLFFFDEDIFVVAPRGEFFREIWQRSFVCKLTYLSDNYFFGKNPPGYHIVNLILHLADAILGTLVLKKLLKLCSVYFTNFQATIIPVIFFTLFLVTPVHSEPLCYILARDGLLVTFFCLLSVLFFIKAGFNNRWFVFFSLFFFLCALFTYEISWMLPVVILGITVFISYVKKQSFKKVIIIPLLYFILFAFWFVIKVVITDKFEVSDYRNKDLFSIDFLTLLKNNAVLFLRNFIPGYKNTSVFLFVGVLFVIALTVGLYKIYKVNKQVFFMCLLFIVLTFFSFSAVAIIGIDSHDSESERYIYFSSSFAVMLLSVLLAVVIKKKALLAIAVAIIVALYGISLFKTSNRYKEGAAIATSYLNVLNSEKSDRKTVFTINQPSQYYGALLFRASSRLNGNTKNSITVLNEYVHCFHPENRCTYITLSMAELSKPVLIANRYNKPIDSIGLYFPSVKINWNDTVVITQKGEAFPFVKNTSVIAAFKDSSLFVFQ
jgi:hypothetical protein